MCLFFFWLSTLPPSDLRACPSLGRSPLQCQCQWTCLPLATSVACLHMVCTSSSIQTGSSPSPFPRSGHSVTTSATAAGELFQFGGSVRSRKSSDVFSTRDFSTTLLQTRGDVPAPRLATCSALTLLICGVATNVLDDQNAPNHDSLHLLNLGTSNHLCQVRHQLIVALCSSIARLDPCCGQ